MKRLSRGLSSKMPMGYCNNVKGEAPANEAGQSLVVVAMLLVVLCGFLGVAIDLGNLFFQKRRMQAAADSGAIAGARELFRGNSAATITSAGKADASSNGFTDSVNGVTVTVNNPPSSGAYSGNASFVETIVRQTEPVFFMKLFGVNPVPVNSRAVAGLGSSKTCVGALDPTSGNAFVAGGSAVVNGNCAIFVNSSASNAFVCSGGAQVNVTSIAVTGGAQDCSSPNPKATANVPHALDPLSSLQAPTVPSGSCSGQTVNLKKASKTSTIDPGLFCSITVSAGTLILNPGLYVLDGGGLSVSGNSSSIQGSGVTFYNAPLGDASGGAFTPIVISSGASAVLSAPTGGTWAGMLFFGSRSAPTGQKNTVSGGSTAKFEGTLYFPTEELDYSGGGSSAAAYTAIIARLVNFSGSSTLNQDFSSLPNGSPIKDVTLVE